MLLDAPALQVRYTLKDILGIVESVLKSRHWRKFDIESTSLVYVPHWFFNFDVYQEAEGKSQTYASQMAIDAVTGKLNPLIVQIMQSVPTKRERETTHGIECEARIPSVQNKEVKDIAAIKVAGEMNLSKEVVTVTGVNLLYIPYWQVWIRLPSGTKRIDLDAISGSPVFISDVPERERGSIEVTMDMLEDLKTPAGWVDYSKKAFDWGFGAAATAGQGIMGSIAPWMLGTRVGQYTLLGLVILFLVIYYFYLG
ncbi:MAG: hypothetical protein KAW41_02030 [Candidatus Diapherotrites archaeon]|nr:hypothetical protein [Candidatus Diapherotrites archaeon]